jgi:2-C-methyl-D-erythritol 4-phosphate cytidylyltransferase
MIRDMIDGKRIGGLILMGGEGRRLGGQTPKQFLLLGGKRVYLHTLGAFLRAKFFDEIVLVCHPEWMKLVSEEVAEFGVRVIAGGESRQESSFLGLEGFVGAPEVVVIHDGVRPFVSEEILRDNALGALRYGAVDTCIPSADTLVYAPGGKEIAEIPNRANFLRGQTPQSFRLELIRRAHEEAKAKGIVATDDCRLVLELGMRVHVVEGSESNMKITTPFDLQLAEHFLTALLPSIDVFDNNTLCSRQSEE